MFQPWRLKVREAEEAFRNGRLEEASRLLRDEGLLEFLPAKQLLAKVAREMTARAGKRLAAGATSAGWHDLEAAQKLGAESSSVVDLRQQFIDRGISEAGAYLQAGDPAAAVARLETLERSGASGRDLRMARQAAGKVLAAQRLCHRGKFAQAEEELNAALSLRPEWKVLDEISRACEKRAATTRRLVEHLHAALADEDWTMALVHAEAILEICPDHEPALDARRRAWAVVGTKLAETRQPLAVGAPRACAAAAGPPAAIAHGASDGAAMIDYTPGPRFLLWVDGVGGYLVCQGDTISLGQPVQGSYVDVPVLADISRLHATIRRDGECYLIDPLRPTRLAGRSIERVTSLADRSEIELGQGVRMRFRMPNPLSRTARLDFVSRHRTSPTTDGVVLLAESCILSPSGKAHITCPNWASEVVLFPQGDELYCRATGRFEIDGVAVEGQAPITRSSQIVGEDFSLSLEKL